MGRKHGCKRSIHTQEGTRVTSLRVNPGPAHSTATSACPPEPQRDVLNEIEFRRMLALERKRSERAKAPFLLMLAQCVELEEQAAEQATLSNIAAVLNNDSRETDVIGWYQNGAILAVLYTGLAGERSAVFGKISDRVKSRLERNLALDEWRHVRLTFHFFPDDWDLSSDSPGNSALYVDIELAEKRNRARLAIKRLIDIVFGTVALIVLSPLFFWMALAIKMTSKGPVFFRQKRIGQYGKPFVFLKFRSMFEHSDVLVHKKFVKELIGATTPEKPLRDERGATYKIRNDQRVTRVGRIIRRMSLDELPQLLNVLKGEMSLVGPRPAIPYEVEVYQTWHRRRVLAAKPGITGIWQVAGRSRVKFDEMVRMDLRYAMAWSPWLDLKILLLTPFAVIRGTGAY